MRSFFNLCENRFIRDVAYDFILSQCDKAEYLNSANSDYFYDLSTELIGTGYEVIISDLIEYRDGSSWAMHGKLCAFSLSDKVKKMIKAHGLTGIIKLNDSVLENLSLYKGEKLLYDTCSHEGYEDIEKTFEKSVSDYCLSAIENTAIYAEFTQTFLKFPDKSIKKIKSDYLKLSDLYAYVQEAWQAMIYQPPKYPLTYNRYVGIAEKYLDGEIVCALKKFKNFKEVYPYGYPHGIEEIKKFVGVPKLESTAIYKEIKFQLEVWNILLLKNGLDLFPEKPPRDSYRLNLKIAKFTDEDKK